MLIWTRSTAITIHDSHIYIITSLRIMCIQKIIFITVVTYIMYRLKDTSYHHIIYTSTYHLQMHHIIYIQNRNYKINAHIHKIIQKIGTHQTKLPCPCSYAWWQQRIDKSGLGQGGRFDVL